MNSSNESVWIIDSGATSHMCNSSNSLSNFIPHFGHNVIISDGSSIPIEGYGTLIILLEDDRNNSTHKLILNNVAFVPNLYVNLISVRALTVLGVSFKFKSLVTFSTQKWIFYWPPYPTLHIFYK